MKNLTPLPFIATVAGVEELLLMGHADLSFWQKWLAPLKLCPLVRNGHAEVILSVTRLSWNGLPFRECVISIALSDGTDNTVLTGYYLLQAFNTARILAWMERRYFQTPYFYGKIALDLVRREARLGPKAAPHLILSAAPPPFAPTLQSEDWQGPIYLPSLPGYSQRLFYVQLAGSTLRWPCQQEDKIMLSAQCPVLEWLLYSGFKGREWGLRDAAFHARSKTLCVEG